MRKIKVSILILILLTASIFTGGCGKRTVDIGKPVIAVSIIPQETFVRKIAGDFFDIVTLVPPGYSPETYQPTPLMMEKLSKAKLYFAIGVPTEQSNILPKLKDLNKDVRVIDLFEIAAETYPPIYLDEKHAHKDAADEHDSHDHEGYDPHIWLSPKRVIVMLEAIAEELSLLDPENKSTYERNAAEYISEIEDLDLELKNTLEGITMRSFFIYHPSFGYFAEDYDLEMLSLELGGKEATAAGLQKMADLAEQKNIRVIFYQAENDSKQTRAFAEEIDGIAMEVDPLSADYIDNMLKMAQTFKDVLTKND